MHYESVQGSVVPRLSIGIYYKLENVQLRKEEYTRALECVNVLAPHTVCNYIPYSLNITPPSIISPPYYFVSYWPAIQQLSDWLRRSRLIASWWWWCENCIAFSDHTHSVPSLIIL